MASRAFSALLDWQIGETKISNINAVGCWYQQYLFLQPSSALKQVSLDANVLFCKMGAGRNKWEREKFYYKTNDDGLPLHFVVAHQKSFMRSHGFPKSCSELLFKGLRRTSSCLGEGAETKAWPWMSVSLQTSFLLWSGNGKHMQKRSGFHQPFIYSTAFTPWILSLHACSVGLSQCSAALPPHLSSESECFTLPWSGWSRLI